MYWNVYSVYEHKWFKWRKDKFTFNAEFMQNCY